jgi:PAS domain S-box-containing protein
MGEDLTVQMAVAGEASTAERVFSGKSEMAALMRAVDWSATPIGPVETWPQSLRTAVSICLRSRFPILLWWGPDLVMLYNDAYRPILGATKHPHAMGQRGEECWPEIWQIIGPMLRGVLEQGEATWSDDQLLILDRNGYLEECYFTFSYSPIQDETGGVGGVFCAVTETTGRVLGERRLRLLRELAAQSRESDSAEAACAIAARVLGRFDADIPFALVYLTDDGNEVTRLAGAAGLQPGASVAPMVVDLTGGRSADPWRLGDAVRTGQAILLEDIRVRFGVLPSGPWDEPPHSALVLPLEQAGQAHPVGLLVAGLSPRRALDDDEHGFFQLVASQIATAVTDARAYEAERARAQALAELDRAKTAFFSNVSHEFRTPLTLMIGPLEQLLERDDAAMPHDIRAEIDVAHRNSLRLLRLVNSLLDFSRIEAGRIEASYEPVDLAALTAELASVFRSTVERAGMVLTVDCPPLPEPLYVDRDMWEKVVLNLISNAFKFTFEGEIAVSLRGTGAGAELTVRDTGAGIPAEELPRIFDRFHRVRGARARSHEGSGIGLALVRELVRLHGGTVAVESAVDAGTTFTVTIPFGTAHLPAGRIQAPRTLTPTALGATPYIEEALRWLPEVQRTNDEQPPLDAEPLSSFPGSQRPDGGERVLVADDNADMRAYLSRMLGVHWIVETAADGATALTAARERPPDLVVADVMMPGMDGFALIEALRADERLKTIPIILLSARAGEEARVEGLGTGADDYLIKPFSARELIARVGSHLELARVRAEGERALRESEGRLARIVENIAEGVVAIGPDGRFLSINAAGERILGVSRDHFVGRSHTDPPFRRLTLDGAPLGVVPTIEEIMAAGDTVFHHEYLIERADGSRVAIARSITAVRGEHGRFLGAVSTFSDITVRRQIEEARERLLAAEQAAREEAEAANRAKDEFLSILSHELRTPLTPILGFSQMLRHAKLPARRRKLAIDMIERNARAQARLVEDLLDVSRILSGKLSVELTSIDLAPVVEMAVANARPEAEAKNLTLEMTLETAAMPVRGDPGRLQQVVANLLSNAIKFTPAEGRIDVLLGQDGDDARITVMDTGAGIPTEYLPQIFERFRQVDSTTARAHGGLGLGLAITQHLVERHGGRITAESAGEGTGATFRVWLPLTAPEIVATEAPEEAEAPAPATRLRGVRGLIVDDDADTRTYLRAMLEDEGATVLTAGSSSEALTILDTERVDVLVADIGMPGEDGYALLARVRKIAIPGEVPAVALTAYAGAEDRRKALEAGFQRHLSKPVDADALVTTIAALVGRDRIH